uniref:Uncharacterized protein n=1 Tax=Daucus carota subsp. sativus TaxID=79200 RepID=A0A175YKK4_DAUCS
MMILGALWFILSETSSAVLDLTTPPEHIGHSWKEAINFKCLYQQANKILKAKQKKLTTGLLKIKNYSTPSRDN